MKRSARLRRFRLVFALLAAVLAVPLVGLVHRALAGVAAERASRQRAVAERLFDEMERALSDLVAREEARPFDAWRFYQNVPDGSGRMRSPLSAAPAEAFVLGYFQVEADGRLTTPLRPADETGARARGDWPAASPAALRAADAALGVAAAWFAARAGDGSPAPRGLPAPAIGPGLPAPGTTAPIEAAHAEAMEAGGPPLAGAPGGGAYAALQALNRGAEERAQRLRRTLEEPAPKTDAFEERELGRAEAMGTTDRARAAARDEARTVLVAVDPLTGHLADAGHLLLYRTVLVGGVPIRQGLVLDLERLGAWLRERVLGGGRLPEARLAFASADAGPIAFAAPWGYRHRFAEPFAAVTAVLGLPTLAGGSGEAAIHALAAVGLLAGGAGLLALYRMVGVTVAFAEQRSHFVAAVTHELRTPLTAIRLYGEMLGDGWVSSEEKRRAYGRAIGAEAERLSRLVDDVLELSRLEKGARKLRVSPGPIGPAVEELVAWMRPHAERQGFALRAVVEPGLPPVRFERDALRHVLVNLLDNALRYARDARRREIEIECRAGGRGARLRVRDHGPGVAPRDLAGVFEPFCRGGDERTRRAGGSGLGLALVKGLVERMGGSVAGANPPGGGFAVEIELCAAGAGGPARGM